MWKLLALCRIALLALFVCIAPAAVAEEDAFAVLLRECERKWPENRAIHLVFHGHSVPAGYHRTPEVRPFDSYPHLLAVRLKERFPHAVINTIVTAIGGEDSLAGASRFERDVLCHKPDLVFLDYGLNDRRRADGEVEQAWRAMIRMARKQRVPVVLLTPTDDENADWQQLGDPLRQRAEAIRRLAEAERVPLADVSAAWLRETGKGTPRAALLSQSNHPNRRGHELVADTLFACLEARFEAARQARD
jgi:acyl-CoA thioesterase I